jgi:hypothetical protein
MSNPLSIQPLHGGPDTPGGVSFVMSQRRLARLLAFAGRSIDDVVNCALAKRHVAHYFKTDRLIQRRRDLLELEAQWNPVGRP